MRPEQPSRWKQLALEDNAEQTSLCCLFEWTAYGKHCCVSCSIAAEPVRSIHHIYDPSQAPHQSYQHTFHLPLILFFVCHRLKDTCGSLSSVLLYFAFFLPTTLNTAWLSVAAGVGILIVPESYNWDERHVEAFAVVLICLVTALGELAQRVTIP